MRLWETCPSGEIATFIGPSLFRDYAIRVIASLFTVIDVCHDVTSDMAGMMGARTLNRPDLQVQK